MAHMLESRTPKNHLDALSRRFFMPHNRVKIDSANDSDTDRFRPIETDTGRQEIYPIETPLGFPGHQAR